MLYAGQWKERSRSSILLKVWTGTVWLWLKVRLTGRELPEGVELGIRDNGRGFDPASVAPEHFGLRIMRERADTIGATLAVASAPGRGTQVVVRWADRATAEGL